MEQLLVVHERNKPTSDRHLERTRQQHQQQRLGLCERSCGVGQLLRSILQLEVQPNCTLCSCGLGKRQGQRRRQRSH